MNPQNNPGLGTDSYSRPIPVDILILIVVVAILVIVVFSFAMRSFIAAGKKDAEWRRKRGATAKDPLQAESPHDRLTP